MAGSLAEPMDFERDAEAARGTRSAAPPALPHVGNRGSWGALEQNGRGVSDGSYLSRRSRLASRMPKALRPNVSTVPLAFVLRLVSTTPRPASCSITPGIRDHTVTLLPEAPARIASSCCLL